MMNIRFHIFGNTTFYVFYSSQFVMKVLQLINENNLTKVNRCTRGYKCVPKNRFVQHLNHYGIIFPHS